MRVEFIFDVLFPKGRISRKSGTCEIQSKDDMTEDEFKADEELKLFIAHNVNQKFKTGYVFNVEIKNVTLN